MSDETPPAAPRTGVGALPSTAVTGPAGTPTPDTVPPPRPGTPDAPPPDPVGYELLGEVGRGGMGVVYRARDVGLDRDVAVKLLAARLPAGSAAARRFRDEARITGQLQHPGIPAVHQVGTLPDGRPFLAMKLIKGRTLADLLDERADPAADRGRFLAVFEQVCQAVAYAHSKHVVHRDLKPQNVMVGAFGEVQVMDWGLAKVLASGGVHPRRPDADPDETTGTEIRSTRDADLETQAGSLLGTPAFMPPEQAIGAIDQIDARSDVFGLGAILSVILTGRPPFVADTAESARQLAAKGKLGDCFARLAACGAEPALVALCVRCLSPEKADRPADAGAVAAAVAALRAAAEDRAKRAEVDRAAAAAKAVAERKKRRAYGGLAAMTTLLLLVGGAAGGWWYVERDRLARDVTAGLEEADRHHRAERWADATRALERAEARLAGGGPRGLRDRLAEARRVSAFAAELEEARDGIDTRLTPAGNTDTPAALAACEEAFRRNGYDVRADDPADLGARLAASPIREALIGTLDYWATDVSRTDPFRARLRAIASAADPDPARRELRDLVDRGDPDAVVKRVAQFDPARESPRQALILAYFLGTRRLTEPAYALLRRTLIAHPGDPSVHRDLGNALLRYGKTDTHRREAVAHLRVALALRTDSPWAYLSLGNAYSRLGDYDRVIELCDQALAIRPEFAQAHTNRALALLAKGDLAGAEAGFRRALELRPDLPEANAGLVRLLRRADRRDEAVAHLTTWAERDLMGGLAQTRLAEWHVERGDLAAARAALFRASLPRPEPDVLYFYAQVLLWSGEEAGAVGQLERAATDDPQYEPAPVLLAGLRLEVHDLEGAAGRLHRLLSFAPESATGNQTFAVLLLRMGQFANAADFAGRAARSRTPPTGVATVRGWADRLAAADRRFPEFAAGTFRPQGPDEQRAWAVYLTRFKDRHAEAARLFTAAGPTGWVPTEVDPDMRYTAARAAVLAGAGMGVDAAAVTPAERGRFRASARAWLGEELADLARRAGGPNFEARRQVRVVLREWRTAKGLSRVRDVLSLFRLPADEQKGWQAFWTEVAAVERRLAPPERAPPPRPVADR